MRTACLLTVSCSIPCISGEGGLSNPPPPECKPPLDADPLEANPPPQMQTPLDTDPTRCSTPPRCRHPSRRLHLDPDPPEADPPGGRPPLKADPSPLEADPWSCDLWSILLSQPALPHPLDRETPVKTLPCLKLRLRAVILQTPSSKTVH